jgi:hypothetical protein
MPCKCDTREERTVLCEEGCGSGSFCFDSSELELPGKFGTIKGLLLRPTNLYTTQFRLISHFITMKVEGSFLLIWLII